MYVHIYRYIHNMHRPLDLVHPAPRDVRDLGGPARVLVQEDWYQNTILEHSY